MTCPLLRDEQQTSKLRTTAKALHGADLSFHLLESKLLFSSRSEEDEEKVCCRSLCPSSKSSLFSNPRLAHLHSNIPTHPRPLPQEFNMLAYLKECEDFCLGRRAGEEAEKGEFAVIGTRDMADIIQAALVHSKRVKGAGIELRGPSVVSIYNALVSLYRLQWS